VRVDAAPEVTAAARPSGNGRVRIRIGVHNFTATATEAGDLAREILSAIDFMEAP